MIRGDEMKEHKSDINIIYGIEDKPELHKAILLALQHILAMFTANITIPLLVSGTLGLSSYETTFLIQCALLMAGISTFIQIMKYKGIGSGLPIVMGTSNAFIATILAITNTYGLGAVFAASFIGGIFEIIIGKNLLKLKKVFTPLVSGIVVLTIGITLIPVGIRQAAGGKDNMGSISSILISLIVIFTIVFLNTRKSKFLKSSSILIGILVGYLISYVIGMIDITPVLESNWVAIPMPLVYKWDFKIGAIVAMLFMYVATSIETIGDISALTIGAEGRVATDEEMSGGVIADGLSSSLAAIFNGFPNTSYTQNIGVVNLTGVFSRYVVKIGAIILVVLSLLPKFGSLISIMPESVLGGASIAMFSMVAVSGISLLRSVKFNSRNMLIIALSIGFGVGLSWVPEAVQQFPRDIQIFLTSGVVPSGILAIILNTILPIED